MAVNRATEVRIGDRAIPLPVYFPSVSSVKTSLRPQQYLEVLSSLVGANNQYLVSAFDLASMEDPREAARLLQGSRNTGAATLMDSGNYETYWKDARGSWSQSAFHRILTEFPCDLAFGFDEQQPPVDPTEHVSLLISRLRDDQAAAGACRVVPIIHGTADALPALCTALVESTGISMLAVPERQLGAGLIERARVVRAIRATLDNLGRYVILHLLGTGNPISMALYAAMGADSFDGLEWCQTVVDHDTALLYHFSQADFFAKQTAWGEASISFQARTLAHNLDFYAAWMNRLQAALASGDVTTFCRRNFPDRIFRHCASAFQWKLP